MRNRHGQQSSVSPDKYILGLSCMKVWVHSFFLCLIKGVVKLAHEFEVKKKKRISRTET